MHASITALHTTNQLQWCGVFGERHEESHTAMSNTVVCPKYTTIGGWARNHLGGGGGNPQSRFSNPRRACARGLYCHSVRRSFRRSFRLSVCLLPRFLRLRATRQQNSDTNGFVATLASLKKRDFRITAAFESYGVKSKSRSQYANQHWLTSASSAYLGGTIICNAGRVSTPACYLAV